MHKIWDGNPSKSAGCWDEENEWPCRTDKSRTQNKI